jgi:cell fate regulator YaaT (PSP1 superfamily)
MANAVGVCFLKAGRHYWFDTAGLELKQGDQVVAETPNGPELGEVRAGPREIPAEGSEASLKPILRRATVEDVRRANENKVKEQQAFRTAAEKIAYYNLPMKLIAVDCTFDRSKIVFHFVAENRVDFRELAKDLARTLRCRVELHQIGVRDEAKLRGGLGPCGRELCCSSFLADFEPVAIKMAKEQDLSLNPQKISGVCGRLMCCLAYEFACYQQVKRRLPRVGKEVTLPQGMGRISEIDVIRGEVVVALESGGTVRIPVDEFPAPAERAEAEAAEEPADEENDLTAE